MNKAMQMAKAQRQAAIAHHQERAAWLQGESPRWACGTPVQPSDQASLLRQSQNYLANPDAYPMTFCA